ncbi:hypothetical protein ACTMTD_00710 [Streptococcus suis]|uniref:hypothetical protein n=1 Tax=Streptococcus suis TaxID=1307 RepID=UPI003F8BDBBA
MELQLSNFNASGTKLEKIIKALIISQIVLIISTFFNVMYDATLQIGNLNIYGKANIAPICLVCSVIEIIALINRKEKIFLPFRVINTVLILNILSTISTAVIESEKSAAFANDIGNFASSVMSFFTFGLFEMPTDLAQSSKLLLGYHFIRIALLLCSVIYILYLYNRFIKKEELVHAINFDFHKLLELYSKNKLLVIATVLLVISQLLPFNIMNKFLLATPAFADHPIISSVICIVAFLLVSNLLQDNTNNVRLYVIIEIASVLIWNPFYVYRFGTPGLGYLIYLVGLGMLVYSIFGAKLKTVS